MASTIQTRAKLGWFKGELLSSHTYRAALFTASFAAAASITGYTATNESSATGYTAAGIALTPTYSNNSTKAIIDYADVQWTITGTLAFQFMEIYDDTDAVIPDMALGIWDFGSQSITNGTVTIQFPTPDASNSILRLA